MMRGIRDMKTKEEMRGGSGKMRGVIKRSLVIMMVMGVMGSRKREREKFK